MYRLLFLMMISLIACSDEDPVDADFKLGQEAIDLLTSCDRLSDQTTIESTLIGEWVLVGYDCGLCTSPDANQPDISVTIGEEQIISSFQDAFSMRQDTAQWSLIESEGEWFLKTSPRISYLDFSIICSDYFGSSDSIVDGPTYVYGKK